MSRNVSASSPASTGPAPRAWSAGRPSRIVRARAATFFMDSVYARYLEMSRQVQREQAKKLLMGKILLPSEPAGATHTAQPLQRTRHTRLLADRYPGILV